MVDCSLTSVRCVWSRSTRGPPVDARTSCYVADYALHAGWSVCGALKMMHMKMTDQLQGTKMQNMKLQEIKVDQKRQMSWSA